MLTDNNTKRQYLKHGDGWCVWCGEPFATNHSNARTCGGYCRTQLARYRKATGFDPAEPVGRITATAAVAELVGQLLADERDRRELVRVVAEKGAAAMFEVQREQERRRDQHKRTA